VPGLVSAGLLVSAGIQSPQQLPPQAQEPPDWQPQPQLELQPQAATITGGSGPSRAVRESGGWGIGSSSWAVWNVRCDACPTWRGRIPPPTRRAVAHAALIPRAGSSVCAHALSAGAVLSVSDAASAPSGSSST
jgi:hypothetical protein